MPVDPVSRGEAKLMVKRIQRDWYERVKHIEAPGAPFPEDQRAFVRDSLIAISPRFNDHEFIRGEEFSLVDCFMAPLLWRLPMYGIEIPRQAKPLIDYAHRLFERKAFLASLSEAEQEIQ